MIRKVKARALALFAAAAMTSSCFYGAMTEMPDAQAAAKAKLKTKSVKMTVGDKKTIKINGKKGAAKYTFKASNKKIKVSSKGVITALKAGSSSVTVKEKLKKTRKLGTVKVKISKKKNTGKPATPTPVVTPGTQATSAAATSAAATIASATNTPSAPASPTATPLPPLDPLPGAAYGTKNIDFDGSSSKDVASELVVPLGNMMVDGGILEVKADFTQKSGSDQTIKAGFEGTYLDFKLNGAYIDASSKKDAAVSDAQEFTCPDTAKTEKTFLFNFPKYTKDFSLKFSSSKAFTIENLVVHSEPIEKADYAKMITTSVSSTGNNARIKKAIEKARAGEDVTLAYLGGSITEGFAASETNNADCYAETSYNLFKKQYGKGDGSNVHFINAGMSGTPSSLGIIRYQRDVLEQMKHGKYPDILFIDFAVNDDAGSDRNTYESIIRTALDQGSAVILMFVLYNNGNGGESAYTKVGQHYDLAMVSPNIGKSLCKKAGVEDKFNKWFFWPDGHPDVGGHKYMADCIINTLNRIDKEEKEEDNIKSISDIKPLDKNGDKYTGMKTLISRYDISKIDAVTSLDMGGFNVLTDSSQPILQYVKDGVEGMQWFPDVWAHTATSGNGSFKATIKCRSLILAYKKSGSADFGTAECSIDGGDPVKLAGMQSGAWNYASMERLITGDEVKEHTIEIKMQSGNENKAFTIYGIGYCD